LALAAILLRSLIPVGYMPMHEAGTALGMRMAICSGNALMDAGFDHAAGAHRAHAECPFAFAAMLALPPAVAGLASMWLFEPVLAASAPQSAPQRPDRSRPPARASPVVS
jgi:hypothetical protein